MRLCLPLSIAALAVWAVGAQETPGADTVLVNGKIVTVDDQFSTREAIAIRDGKILSLGSTSLGCCISSFSKSNSRVVSSIG